MTVSCFIRELWFDYFCVTAIIIIIIIIIILEQLQLSLI